MHLQGISDELYNRMLVKIIGSCAMKINVPRQQEQFG